MKPLPQFLTSILCCAIACGHVLAWVHMGSCGGNCNLQVSAVEGSSNSCCSHCCHPPSVELTDVGHSGLQIGGSGDSHGRHDCEGCAICQSVKSPCGSTWQFFRLPGAGATYRLVQLPVKQVFALALLSIAHPRGPPSLA